MSRDIEQARQCRPSRKWYEKPFPISDKPIEVNWGDSIQPYKSQEGGIVQDIKTVAGGKALTPEIFKTHYGSTILFTTGGPLPT